MIIKIQDQDLLLLHMSTQTTLEYSPPPLALFYARNFSGLERKSNQESKF